MTTWYRSNFMFPARGENERVAAEAADYAADGLVPPGPPEKVNYMLYYVKTIPMLMGPRHARDHELFADLLRDIAGDPFRPVTAARAWLTPTGYALAEGVYADRAFDRLPILADALADAGCEDPDVLAHCRGAGTHTRGCWVVDFLLGKS